MQFCRENSLNMGPNQFLSFLNLSYLFLLFLCSHEALYIQKENITKMSGKVNKYEADDVLPKVNILILRNTIFGISICCLPCRTSNIMYTTSFLLEILQGPFTHINQVACYRYDQLLEHATGCLRRLGLSAHVVYFHALIL